MQFPYDEMVEADKAVSSLNEEGSMCSQETDYRIAGMLYGLLLYLRPKRILEVGSYVGQTLTFVQNVIESCPQCFTGGVGYTCVDMDGDRLRSSPLEPKSSANMELDYQDGLSIVALDKLVKAGEKYDLVIVDGSHSFKCALEDLHRTAHLVSNRGVVLVHDTANAEGEVRRAVDQFLHNWNGAFTAIHLTSEFQGVSVITRSHRTVWGDDLELAK